MTKKEVQLYFKAKGDEDNPYAAFAVHENEQEVKPEWLEQIVKAIDGVDSYYYTNNSTSTISFEKKKMDSVAITGVSQDYFKVKKYDIVAGRTLNSKDYKNFSRIILLDTVLADELFGKGNYEQALNKVVSLDSKDYLVVGVYKTDQEVVSFAGGISGGAIMANTQVASEFHVKEIGSVYLYIGDVKRSLELGNQAAAMLTTLSHVKEGEYAVPDNSQIINDINAQFSIMTTVVGSIAGISLLVVVLVL